MNSKLTYKDAGVDIVAAAGFVDDISQLRLRTEKKRKLFQAFGLFAASYDLSDYKNPVIVTGCDGVGTKIELLLKHDQLETAGKDLVAMNVNDVLTTGADPVLFLDYLGIPKVDKVQLTRLIAGMVDWLESCDCILAGGETAEMPGIVKEDTIEMSGFCIGVAEKEWLLDPTTVQEGDVVIGFPSDGFHANGWSLVRRILDAHRRDFSEAEILSLLAPTRLYHKEVWKIRELGIRPRAMAHITGGGLIENLERLVKLAGCGASLVIPSWELGAVPKVLRQADQADCLSTFNMGWGWAVIVDPGAAEAVLTAGPGARVLGRVEGTDVRVKVKTS